jgi:hypothetical protein
MPKKQLSPETLAFILVAGQMANGFSPSAMASLAGISVAHGKVGMSQPKRRRALRRMTHRQRALQLKRNGRP